MKSIFYRKGYKYQLAKNYIDAIPIYPSENIATEYASLGTDGALLIRSGYAFDGPSGPTIDTKSAMRGSLIHDALYQMLRLGLLPAGFREAADKVYEDKCIEDGMWKARAWLHFRALRRFGWSAAQEGTEPQILAAP